MGRKGKENGKRERGRFRWVLSSPGPCSPWLTPLSADPMMYLPAWALLGGSSAFFALEVWLVAPWLCPSADTGELTFLWSGVRPVR